MFGVKHYSDKLEKMRIERGVNAAFKHKLIAIDPARKIATFLDLDTNKKVQKSFDMLHVSTETYVHQFLQLVSFHAVLISDLSTTFHQVGPHMSAPAFLRNSPISDSAGWVDVDKHTLKSTKYDNIFGLGDCTNTPNSKTAAAVTSQAPVVVHNIERSIDKLPLDGMYSGYASCPLVIARNKVMLAEFGYGGKLAETFGPDGKFPHRLLGTDGEIPHRFFFFLKETIFPYVYWNLWTKVS